MYTESQYNFKRKEKETGDIRNTLDELEIIAQRVGGDLGMQVKLGKAGQGSFFNPDKISITLDPEHVGGNSDGAKFVTAHEGAHRAISKSPSEMGLSSDKIYELYSQLGFGYIQNAIEDPAVNDWFQKKFPGLKGCTRENYNRQFVEEGAILSTPEVQRVAEQLGYWPKFAQFGSEIIRNWHQKRFSKNLDKEVVDALSKTKNDFEQSIKTIPGKDIVQKKEVVEKARERFRINTEKVWPEVKKLIDKDINNENLRQEAQDIYDKIKEIEDLQEQTGQVGGQGERKQEEKQSGKEGQPGGKDSGEESEKVEKEKQESDGQVMGTDELSEKLDKIKEDLELQGFSRDVLDEIKDKIEKAKGEMQDKGGKGKEGDKEKEKLEKCFGDPVPMDELSEQAKKELQDAFDKLSEEQKEKLEQESKKRLEDFEDELNKEMEGRLNKEKTKSHQEQRKERRKQYKNKKQTQEKETQEEKHEQTKKNLKEILESEMTEYEKIRAEQMFLIDSFYLHLKKILQPEEEGEDESGYPSGYKPDLVRAMQSGADVSQKTKIWIRESEPEVKDYRFWHLVDMSGSMNGEPIQEVYKGFVTTCEAVNRVEDFNSDKINIHQGVSGFDSSVYKYKKYDERLTSSIEENLSKMLHEGGGGTDTYKATKHALGEMEKDIGKTGNFLLTFTDGSPNDIYSLAELIKDTKEERDKKKIKIGIVWLIENEVYEQDSENLQELMNECGYDFGLTMSTKEFSEEESRQGKRNFSERLADLLEDIINNPEKY